MTLNQRLLTLTVLSSLSLNLASGITWAADAQANGSQSVTGVGSTHKSLEERLEKARKKGKGAEISDALYDLAKAYFEAGQVIKAEKFMREALQVEAGLSRPEDLIRIRVALAAILVSQQKKADAYAVYEDALDLARAKKMDGHQAVIIDSMGALALTSGRLDEAERLFQEARTLAVAAKSPSSESSVLVNLAVVARARHDNSTALDLLNKAVALVQDQKDNRVLAAALMELGRAQADGGDIDKAITSLKQAADLYQADLEPTWQGKALLSLGQILLVGDRSSDAEETFQRATDCFKEDQYLPGLISSQIGMGATLAKAGKFSHSETAFHEAMRLAKATGNANKVREILSEIAYSYYLQGAVEKALNKYLEAYDLLKKHDPNNTEDKGVVLSDIAMTYKAIGQPAAAIKYYEMAVTAFQQADDLKQRAMALNSLAVAYLDNAMPKEFRKYYQLSKEAFENLKDQHGLALLTYNLAQLEMMQQHHADAVPLYEEALSGMRATRDARGEGQVLRGLALAYLYLGRSGKSLELYQQALPGAQSSGNLEAQWECELGLGKSYKLLGQLDDALAHLQKSVELVEQEQRQLSRDSSKTFNMDLRQDCYMELVDALVQKGQIPAALEMVERGRARAFLDLLEGRRSRRPNDLVADSNQGGVQSNPVQPAAITAPAGTRAVEIVPRQSAIVEPSVISAVNSLPPTLDEIKNLVRQSNSDFVEYYVLRDKLLAFVIHPNGQIALAPPVTISSQQLGKQIAALSESITAQSATAANREASLKSVYKLLIEPVLPLLSKQPDASVTIIPHQQLFSVPFAALLKSNGRYLIEDYTLNFAPAIGVLRATQRLKQDADKQGDDLLGFGNPITKQIEFLGTLPFSEKEVKHIAELFAAGKSIVKIGQQATKAEFKDLSPKFKYLHLATHGLIDEQHPMDSALVLAPSGSDDGLLTVKDILQLPSLKSRLVVLSACQTGRGKITGDGVVGLSRSFIIAGTPSIVVSQWNVDDVMTEYQMTAFYKALLKGSGLAKSLREAQLQTIAFMERISGPASKNRANPRLWAAFQLMGEPL